MKAERIYSEVPLIISKGSTLTFESVEIKNVTSKSYLSIGSFDSSTMNFNSLSLTNVDSTFIQALNCGIAISNAFFSNEKLLNNPSFQTRTQFLVLIDSVVSITSSEFHGNSVTYPRNGGVTFIINS